MELRFHGSWSWTEFAPGIELLTIKKSNAEFLRKTQRLGNLYFHLSPSPLPFYLHDYLFHRLFQSLLHISSAFSPRPVFPPLSSLFPVTLLFLFLCFSITSLPSHSLVYCLQTIRTQSAGKFRCIDFLQAEHARLQDLQSTRNHSLSFRNYTAFYIIPDPSLFTLLIKGFDK